MKNKLPISPVTYFVAEYALSSDAPTYAGGLGVLAGDYLLEAAKEKFPFVLVSLHYDGFDAARDGYEEVKDASGKTLVVCVPIEKREVGVRAWIKYFGENTAAILLDTNVAENSGEDRAICKTLYDSHLYVRIKQQLVLGVGGPEILSCLGVSPKIYHLNEGHTSLTALGIIALEMKTAGSFSKALEAARKKIVFTKHTIFSDAGLYISSSEFFDYAARFCSAHLLDPKEIFDIGKYEKDEDLFSTTRFGIKMSARRNAVSRLHMEQEKIIHPSSDFSYVTNGIFEDRWRFCGVKEKSAARSELVKFVREKTGISLDPKALTLVWARRFAAYKRPKLLFTDIPRLKKILFDEKNPVQIVISGKANLADEEGQKMVEMVRGLVSGELKGKIAYIPDYSLEIAAKLVCGADLWVNTPERGKEACGTSGMKAALNGALMCSISDGWMDEVDWKDAGWVLPEEKTAEVLYGFLEEEIVPAFSRREKDTTPHNWSSRMEKTVSIVENGFGADRMLADYRKKLYFL